MPHHAEAPADTALLDDFVDAAHRAASPAEAVHGALAALRARLGAQSALLFEKSAEEYRCVAALPEPALRSSGPDVSPLTDPGAGHAAATPAAPGVPRVRGASPTPEELGSAEAAAAISVTGLASNGFLLNRLKFHTSPLPFDRGDVDTWLRWARESRPAHLPEIQALERAGARLAAPLRTSHETRAVLLLGPPADGHAYTAAERQMIRFCAPQLALLLENARLTDRIVEQEKLRRDLALAAEVQKRLLPDGSPADGLVSLAAVSLPARGVGGDYYDFLDHGDRRMGIALADVAGKGVAAALLMSVVQASLRVLTADRDIPLPELAARLNHFLHRSTQSNSYATFFYAQIDEPRRQMHYVNAGHNPPYLLRFPSGAPQDTARAEAIEELSTGGTVLGLFPESRYEQATIDLRAGDVLIAYTDGVTEALSPADEEFGEARLKETVGASLQLTAEEIAARLAGVLKEWIKDRAQHDDLTFIVMRVRPD